MKMRFKTLIVAVLLSIGMTCGAEYNVNMSGSPEVTIVGGDHGSSQFEYTFIGGHTFKYMGYDLYVVDELGNRVNTRNNPFSTLEINDVSTMKLENGVRYITDKTYTLDLRYEVKETVTIDKRWGIMFDLYVSPVGEEHTHWRWCNNVNTYTVPEPSSLTLGIFGMCIGCVMIVRRRIV